MRLQIARLSRLLSVVAFVGLSHTGAIHADHGSLAPCFHRLVLYDNTHYTDLNLEQYGLIKSNILYEDAASKRAIAAGQIPDERLVKRRLAAQD